MTSRHARAALAAALLVSALAAGTRAFESPELVPSPGLADVPANVVHPAKTDLPGKTWDLKKPHTPDQTTAQSLENLGGLDCAECHQTIAKEWAATRHGLAWEESVYQDELTKVRKPSKCHSCHAPQPILVTGLGKRPKVRTTDVHLGVDCAACHVGAEGAIHGPFGAPTEAHASIQSDVFTDVGSNELCITCHDRSVGPVIGIAGDFDDEDLGDQGFSCVACHMAKVERPIANDPNGTQSFASRPGRSHFLQTPRDPQFLRQAFAISIAEREGVRGIVIANRAGHRIPGLNDRVLEFKLQFLSESAEEISQASLTVTREEPLKIRSDLWQPIPTGAHKARVIGTHEAHSLAVLVVFLEEDLGPF